MAILLTVLTTVDVQGLEEQIWWLRRKIMCLVLDMEDEESIAHLGETEILF